MNQKNILSPPCTFLVATSLASCKKEESSRNINGHEYVDLGLSVKWATCNVGADSPEEYGDYFAFGETAPKNEYTEENCATWDIELPDISGNPEYDAARANWGGSWRLPTLEEIYELTDNCSWEWTEQNGHNGMRVTGPNGNSIFLPAGGYREGEARNNRETAGWYWTKTRERGKYGDMRYFSLFFSERSTMMYDMGDPYLGKSIRPVYNEE